MEKGKKINVLKEESVFLKEKFESLGNPIKTDVNYHGVVKFLNEKFPKKKKWANDGENEYVLSIKTLKRFFQFETPNKTFYFDTPTTLAQAVGFKDWGDFIAEIGNKWIPSTRTYKEVFEDQREKIRRLQEDMIRSKDGTYTLGWYPEKYIIFEHDENYTYKVLESKRMTNQKDEKFDAPDFCLSTTSTSEDSKLPDIMILDDIGYFDIHEEIPEL